MHHFKQLCKIKKAIGKVINFKKRKKMGIIELLFFVKSSVAQNGINEAVRFEKLLVRGGKKERQKNEMIKA